MDEEFRKQIEKQQRNRGKLHKFNPTNRHLIDQKPINVIEAPPSRRLNEHFRTGLPLHFGEPSPSMEWSYQQFERKLAGFPNSCRIFMDTGFITSHEIPDSLWDGITRKKLFITEGVWKELNAGSTPTINVAFRNLLSDVRRKEENGEGDKQVSFTSIDDWSDDIRDAAKHYMGLLTHRKHAAIVQAANFQRTNGREPTEQELQAACSLLGKRGWRMAYKGYKERGKPRSTTDEELITTAVFNSSLYLSPTIILTRDNDVFDHFRTLIYLLDTHYRSMLVAAHYAASSRDVLVWNMVMNEETSRFFRGSNNQYVRLPEGIVESVLPDRLRWAECHCILLSTSNMPLMVSAQSFTVVQDFEAIIRLRGRLKGRNTDLLGDRNFHIFLPGNDNRTGRCCGIVEDVLLSGYGTHTSYLDMILALRTDHGFDLVYTPCE